MYDPGESVRCKRNIVYVMPGSSGTEGHHTPRLVEAGEILRTLSPPTLATLHLLIDYDVSNQSDMADIIGCARPTVSRYLQSLEDLSMPLARKQGRHYKPTDPGRQVFAVIENLLSQLGRGPHEIEWSDDDDQKEVENNLSPLYDSRSTWPFLILESIRTRVHYLDTPDPVSVEDIVIDVRARQRDIGKNVTAKQIRKTLWRFDEKEVVKFDGGKVTLDTKGKAHIRLLHKLTQILERQTEDESTARAASSESDSHDDEQDLHSRQLSDPHNSERIANLLDPREFRGGRRTVNASRGTDQTSTTPIQERCTIVPAYYLVPANEAETGDEQNVESELPPMLPFTSLTVTELANYASQLEQEYDDDTLLKPYWALRTEAGLSPLGPAQLTLGPLSEEER
jgi:Mn-dependent DtxR family transcriptional regulator